MKTYVLISNLPSYDNYIRRYGILYYRSQPFCILIPWRWLYCLEGILCAPTGGLSYGNLYFYMHLTSCDNYIRIYEIFCYQIKTAILDFAICFVLLVIVGFSAPSKIKKYSPSDLHTKCWYFCHTCSHYFA